jgi:hypothetical protein
MDEGFRTKILNIAAFLCAAGLQLIDTPRVDGEVYFIFSPKEEAEKLVESYFAGSATVDPRELFARLNDLRDLIFGGQRNSKAEEKLRGKYIFGMRDKDES